MAEALRRRLWGASPLPLAGICVVVGLLVRLPLIWREHSATPGFDSADYLRMATAIAHGEGLGLPYRMPGYSVFIAALSLLPGSREDAVVVCQLVAGSALAGVVVLVAWRPLGKVAGVLAGALLAVTPATPYAEYAILADFLFAVLVFAAGVVIGRVFLRPRQSVRDLIAIGVLCALATYVRPTGEFLLLAPIATVLLVTRSVRATARAGVVVGATFAVLMAPWFIRNASEYDTFSVSIAAGDTLFVRAFEVDKMPIPTDTPTGELVARVSATRGSTRLVTAVTHELTAQGVSYLDALRAQQSLAERAILRHPWTYAVGTGREMGRLRLDPRDVNVGSDVGPHLPSPPEATRTVWRLSSVLASLWWILSLHAFGGLLVLCAPSRPARVLGLALVSVWLAVALGTALARGALTRYAIELAPITLLLASAGASMVGSAVWRLVSRGRSPVSGPSAIRGGRRSARVVARERQSTSSS